MTSEVAKSRSRRALQCCDPPCHTSALTSAVARAKSVARPFHWAVSYGTLTTQCHASPMATLEQLTPGAANQSDLADTLATVASVKWFGAEALGLTYKDPAGQLANELPYRHDEPRLTVAEQGRRWIFDGDGALFRLVTVVELQCQLRYPRAWSLVREGRQNLCG